MAQEKKPQHLHFVDDRPYSEDNQYDPEEGILDPEVVEQDLEEEFRSAATQKKNETGKKRKRPAA